MSTPSLPSALLPSLPLTGSEIVRVRQGSVWVYATTAEIAALVPDATVPLAAANASIVALTQRVAALEGKPDPCVALSGSLTVATLLIGTTDVAVPVPGLLSTDRVSVEILADLPAGLVLGGIRPSPTAAGILLVQTTATLSLAGKSAIPIAVTALR